MNLYRKVSCLRIESLQIINAFLFVDKLLSSGIDTKIELLRKGEFMKSDKCDCKPICTSMYYSVETSQSPWDWEKVHNKEEGWVKYIPSRNRITTEWKESFISFKKSYFIKSISRIATSRISFHSLFNRFWIYFKECLYKLLSLNIEKVAYSWTQTNSY